MADANAKKHAEKIGTRPEEVCVSEVGLRDGLQSIKPVMGLEAKKAWITAEAEAGVREIEVGSFVSYKLLPQMADTAALIAHAKQIKGLTVAVLVPNLYGAKLAIDAGADKIGLPLSVSETHSVRNVNRTHAQMLDEIRQIAAALGDQPQAARPEFDVGLATAFGCNISGAIEESLVVQLAEACIEAGADRLCLSDTTGSADPQTVRDRVRAVQAAVGASRLDALHLHNTRGLGLANVIAGLEEGISTFDASLGGLGGCPTAPGASGNIVTEDLVFMLNAMGLATGIDIDKLLSVRAIVAQALPDEPLYGFVPEAGVPKSYQAQT